MQAHATTSFSQNALSDIGQIAASRRSSLFGAGAAICATPPSVPHAFITESDSYGHVLTVREELVWPLLEVLSRHPEAFGLLNPLMLADKPNELAALKHYWQLIERESTEQPAGCEHTGATGAGAFTCCCVMRSWTITPQPGCAVNRNFFSAFTLLIDNHFHQH